MCNQFVNVLSLQVMERAQAKDKVPQSLLVSSLQLI